MKIKEKLYTDLAPQQRVIAAVEAVARGDDTEIHRLIKTCPRVTVSQTDPAFSDVMIKLIAMAAATEAELRGHALTALTGLHHLDTDRNLFEQALQDMANTKAGWEAALKELGLDSWSVSKLGVPKHYVVQSLEGKLPQANREKVAILRETILSIVKAETA